LIVALKINNVHRLTPEFQQPALTAQSSTGIAARNPQQIRTASVPSYPDTNVILVKICRWSTFYSIAGIQIIMGRIKYYSTI